MYKIIFEENEIRKEVELNDVEFKVLNLAVNHNHGIINLCSETEAIKKLINIGFLNFNKNDFLEVKNKFQDIFKKYIPKSKIDLMQGITINNTTVIES